MEQGHTVRNWFYSVDTGKPRYHAANNYWQRNENVRRYHAKSFLHKKYTDELKQPRENPILYWRTE